jgi:hypothetical protein
MKRRPSQLPEDVEPDQLWRAPDGQHYKVISVSNGRVAMYRATPAGRVLSTRPAACRHGSMPCLGDLGATIEASNQARVHLWYASYWHPYEPLCSSCDGIDRFLVPAACVGVRNPICRPPGLGMVGAPPG